MVVARASARLLAVPCSHVIETMRPLAISAVAGVPAHILGIAIIRGVPTPVVDAAGLLGMPGGAIGRFVVLRLGERQAALAVDSVLGLRLIEASASGGLPPLLDGAAGGAVEAAIAVDAELALVLASTKIIPDDTWAAIEGDAR
jgi:purine-binding chemotaxis protein CheW